jgi:hypothetical protein
MRPGPPRLERRPRSGRPTAVDHDQRDQARHERAAGERERLASLGLAEPLAGHDERDLRIARVAKRVERVIAALLEVLPADQAAIGQAESLIPPAER